MDQTTTLSRPHGVSTFFHSMMVFAVLGLPAASAAEQKSLLPDVLYDIDPGLPATTAPLGTSAGIQLDTDNGIVAMRLAGSNIVLRHGTGKSAYIRNGLDGKPIISNPQGGKPGGWDSFVLDPAVADPIAAQERQKFAVALVERRRAYAACDIMKLYAKDGAHIHFSPNAQGRILIGQNNGPGTALETQAEPLDRWDTLYLIYDGRRAWLLRNGEVAAATPAFKGGNLGTQGIQYFELLNGCAMDVASLVITTQAPTPEQINAEAKRISRLFPSVSAQKMLANDVFETGAPASADAAPEKDARYLTKPNNPLREPLPVRGNASLGNGLRLNAGARNGFSLVMGSAQQGANMTTSQSIRDRFFLNYMEGDLNKTIGSPMDTGQPDNTTFAAVARHFPVGDPNDLHVMAPDGMHLRAICSHDHTDCKPGHVWGAMVRLPFEWRPGMTLKVRYKSPKGDHSWAPIWMFTGQQISPGPGGNPYQGFGGPDALYRAGKKNFEIDWNDNFSRAVSGVPTGYQIDFGTPDIYGTAWKIKPHATYRANGNGWRYYGKNYNPDFERAPFDWSEGFHNLVGNWRGDGSNLIDLIIDGKLVATQYMEYPQSLYAMPDGHMATVAMHLIIGNQAIPRFSRNPSAARDNDGIPDGWTIVVQEISGWYGNVANIDSLAASPENGAR